MLEHKLKIFYNNVLCQALTNDGNFLFAGNSFGDIFLKGIQQYESDACNIEDDKIFPQGDFSINCLWYHNETLVVGTRGCLYGLKWDSKNLELSNKRSWEILIPDSPDINCFCMETESDTFLVGCDDGKIYFLDLNNHVITGSFKEHTNAVYCITSCMGSIYSGGQDGVLLMWSLKGKQSFDKIEPYKFKDVARPEFGNFISSCDVYEDWLICGGGPKLILWSLRTKDLVHIFDFPGKIFCTNFFEEASSIFVGGTHRYVHVYHLNGALISEMLINSTSVWSIGHNKGTELVCFAGYSNQLSIVADFRLIVSQINFYKEDEFKDQQN